MKIYCGDCFLQFKVMRLILPFFPAYAAYVSNLPTDTVENDLEELFKPFGPIATRYLSMDKVTGECKGFAFVHYYKKKDLLNAIRSLNGLAYNGCTMKVHMAENEDSEDDDFNAETSTSSGFNSFPDIENYKSEAARLATFEAWIYPYPDPKDFAECGLVSLGQRDAVQCAFCQKILFEWRPGDLPNKVHADQSPDCPFVQGLEVGNIPLDQSESTPSDAFNDAILSTPTDRDSHLSAVTRPGSVTRSGARLAQRAVTPQTAPLLHTVASTSTAPNDRLLTQTNTESTVDDEIKALQEEIKAVEKQKAQIKKEKIKRKEAENFKDKQKKLLQQKLEREQKIVKKMALELKVSLPKREKSKQTKFPCTSCDHVAKTKRDLSNHIDSKHLKLKKYACTQCNYSCDRANYLPIHVKRKHENVKLVACDDEQCDKKFATKKDMLQHVADVHEGVEHTCPYCYCSYSREQRLKKHVKDFHPSL